MFLMMQSYNIYIITPKFFIYLFCLSSLYLLFTLFYYLDTKACINKGRKDKYFVSLRKRLYARHYGG